MMPLRWLVEQNADLLVAHRPSLTLQQIRGVEAVATRLGARRTIVLYQFANEQWLAELGGMGIPHCNIWSSHHTSSRWVAYR